MPGAVTHVQWNAAPLTQRLVSAAAPAAGDALQIASSRNPAPHHIRVALSGGGTAFTLAGRGPLAGVFEHGRRGGYPIAPKGVAIRFPSGDFFRGDALAGGPMAAKPYIAPAREAWAGLYLRRAAAAMGGFR